MRPKGSAEALEVRRLTAGRHLLEGKGIREVARLVGASPSSVERWKEALEEGGLEALAAKPHPGRPPRLTPGQKESLQAILLRGPRAAAFSTDLWTLARIAKVIEDNFGVKYHPGYIWHVLRDMGWSAHKPERRARERDEAAIQRWREEEWLQIKKKARERGWSVVLIDESGFMLQPVVRRTWAPRGQTPIQYSWDRHDRLSVISAITVAPSRRRLGLYFQIHSDNVHWDKVIAFLTMLHQHLRRKFIVVLDRLNAHRKAVRLLKAEHPDWFEVEWLPAYAPDLNPVEMVWNHTKYADLANFIPEDLDDLHQAITTSLASTRAQGHLIHSFFRHVGLEL